MQLSTNHYSISTDSFRLDIANANPHHITQSIMKTKISHLILALWMASILGCKESKNSQNEGKSEPTKPSAHAAVEANSVASYFPSKTMVKEYTGGYENGGETHRVLKADGKHVHVLVENGGTSMLLIYEVSDVQVKQVYSSGEEYSSTEVLQEFVPNRDSVVLAAPLAVGKQWQNEDGMISEITALDYKITTLAGTYETIEVSHHHKEFPTKSYYAKGIGLVHLNVPEYPGIVLKEIK